MFYRPKRHSIAQWVFTATVLGSIILGSTMGFAPNLSAQETDSTSNEQTDVVRAKLQKMSKELFDNTNQLIEKTLLNTAEFNDVGMNATQIGGCLADYSCAEPGQQSLDNILRFALATAPQIASARSRLSAAEANIEGAQWAFYPTPGMQVIKRSVDKKYVVQASIEQPLYTGGRLTAGLDKARAGSIVAQTEIAMTQLDLAFRIINQYTEWFAADRKQRLWQTVVDHLDGLTARVERVHRAGGGAASSIDQAKSKRDIALAEQLSAYAIARSAIASLSQLIGTRLDTDLMQTKAIVIPTISKGGETVSPEDLLAQIHAASPYIANARATIALAEAEKKNTDSRIMPDIFARLEHNNVRGGKNDNRVFVGVRTNIGPGLSFGASQRSAENSVLAAKTDLRAAERQVKSEVVRHQTQYNAGRLRVKALISVIASLEKYYQSLERQFDANGKNSIDVINAQMDIAYQQAMLADAQASMLSASWHYRLLVQGFPVLLEDIAQ